MAGLDFAEPTGKRVTEEKTQREKLEKDLFPSLYDELNLSKFVNEDESVRTKELGLYLRELGFTEETVKYVLDYLNGKGDWKTAQLSVEYEYTYNRNIKEKLKEFNELIGSIKKELKKTVGNEKAIDEAAFRMALNLIGMESIPTITECNIRLDFKINNTVFHITRVVDLPIPRHIKKELEDIRNFKPKKLSKDEETIVENAPQIAAVAANTWNSALDTTLTLEEKEKRFEEYRRYLISLGLSEDSANWIIAELGGYVYDDLIKQGKEKEAKEFREQIEDLLVNKYGMDLNDFNRAFFSAAFGIELEKAPTKEVIEILGYSIEAGLITFDEFIETIIRPLFGGTEEMQIGEAEVKRLEEIKNFIQKISEEDREALLKIIEERIEELNRRINEEISEEEKNRIKDIIEYLEEANNAIEGLRRE